MNTDTAFSVYTAARQLRTDLADGVTPQESVDYFADHLGEAARLFLDNVDTVRRLAGDLHRKITATTDKLDQGYGIDRGFDTLGQTADDYNRAVEANRELAHNVQKAANTAWQALGKKDAVQQLLEEFVAFVFASVKA